MLAHRPRIALELAAGPSVSVDRIALAQQQVEFQVAGATAEAVPQAQVSPVDFASQRAQAVLDEFARERLRPKDIATKGSFFEPLSAEAPSSPLRVAHYRAIFDALVAHETIGGWDLRRLLQLRARVIANALGSRGVAAERIAVTARETSPEVRQDWFLLPVSVEARRGVTEPHEQ